MQATTTTTIDHREQRREEWAQLERAFGAAGFGLQQTGGGHEAFMRHDGPRVTLVTSDDDTGVTPDRLTDPVYAATYEINDDGDLGDEIDSDSYDSAAHYLARWI